MEPAAPRRQPPVSIGVSLKMYLGHRRTLAWCRDVAALVRASSAVASGAVELFVLPSFTAVPAALDAFAGTGVGVGAQDLSWEDEGPFTGEVSGRVLRELGCTHVEVGHAERRRLFGEDDAVVAAKTAAALRNGLVPVLCVGEAGRVGADEAARGCVAQVRTALERTTPAGVPGRVLVAYEPQEAIGADEPAPVAHVVAVCTALQAALREDLGVADGRVVYGGSAGPGLLTALGGQVAGLFLGRSAHDPAALGAVLEEAVALPYS